MDIQDVDRANDEAMDAEFKLQEVRRKFLRTKGWMNTCLNGVDLWQKRLSDGRIVLAGQFDALTCEKKIFSGVSYA